MSAKVKNDKSTIQRKYKDELSIRNFVTGNRIMEESIECIKCILQNEGYKNKKNYFKNEIALNLDKVEFLLKKGTLRDKTVDFVVGLEKDWLLLVEAKLDVDNVDNIIKGIFGKVSHSMDILKSNINYIHSESIVIILLKDQNFQQRSHRLRQLLLARTPNIKPLRVCDFYNNYFMPDN